MGEPITVEKPTPEEVATALAAGAKVSKGDLQLAGLLTRKGQ